MPLTNLPEDDNHPNDDFNRLAAFVRWLREMLIEIVSDEFDLVPNGLRESAKTALNDVGDDSPIDELLKNLNDGMTDEVRLSLRRHGLTGTQLTFKFKAIRYCIGTTNTFLDNSDDRNTKMAWIWRTFDVVDDVLESLLEALGAGSAPKEIKEIIKKIIRIRR